MTGDSAWSGRSREPTLTTDGKLCRKRILSRPTTWSQRQPISRAAAQWLERHPVDAIPPNPDHDPVPRRLYLKQRDFVTHCPGCRALVSGCRAQGHTDECRIRVEGEPSKTEEGKARLRAAASRVGDAPTGRASKRAWFAENRDDDNAEMPGATSGSAPSNLPAEALPAPSLRYPRLQSKCLIK